MDFLSTAHPRARLSAIALLFSDPSAPPPRAGAPTADAFPWLQDALDAAEFVAGAADARWGAARAAMGREAPWALDFLAIGNEDCGKVGALRELELRMRGRPARVECASLQNY